MQAPQVYSLYTRLKVEADSHRNRIVLRMKQMTQKLNDYTHLGWYAQGVTALNC